MPSVYLRPKTGRHLCERQMAKQPSSTVAESSFQEIATITMGVDAPIGSLKSINARMWLATETCVTQPPAFPVAILNHIFARWPTWFLTIQWSHCGCCMQRFCLYCPLGSRQQSHCGCCMQRSSSSLLIIVVITIIVFFSRLRTFVRLSRVPELK